MKVKTVSGLGSTPARVHRPTGTVFLNKDFWHLLSEQDKKFILAHEKGHFCKQTKSEIQADMFAFNEFYGTEPESLRKIVKVISENLNIKSNPEHQKRYKTIVFKALITDWIYNNNKNAYKILNKMEKETIYNLFIDYLKSKNVADVNELSDDKKELFLADFMLTPEMQELTISEVKKELENDDDFSDFAIGAFFGKIFKKGEGGTDGNKKPLFSPETKDKFKNAFNKVAGGLLSKLGKGLGFKPDTKAISETINPANNIAVSSAPLASSTPETSPDKEDDKKAKNKKMLIIGGIVVFVIGIGIALYFGLRKK